MLQHFIFVMCGFMQKRFELKNSIWKWFWKLIWKRKINSPSLLEFSQQGSLLPVPSPSPSWDGPTSGLVAVERLLLLRSMAHPLAPSPTSLHLPLSLRQPQLPPPFPCSPTSPASRLHLRSTRARAAMPLPIPLISPCSCLQRSRKVHHSHRDPPHSTPANRAISASVFRSGEHASSPSFFPTLSCAKWCTLAPSLHAPTEPHDKHPCRMPCGPLHGHARG
jgi:hypothetical protein